ncbi:cytidylyltransferase domain-containing protein [Dongia sp.]|uniref:acylneuraminate cytidylyltransferase family protein n=1 Tax=Dongia sp. TaxID=1977262 RepID=UPI0035B4A3FD
MSRNGLSVLAVVPARGGSKGIPRKNLCKVAGKSLVERAALVARALTWLDASVLSTDDPEIAAEGRRCGLAVPFLRPAEYASDQATGVAAWRHAWLESEASFGRRFDCSVLLQPTTPLRRPEDVARTLDAMMQGRHLAAATVSPVPGHFAPQKILRLRDGLLEFLHSDGARHSNRQSIPTYYSRNGLCYAAMREAVVDRMEIVESDCVGVVTEGHVANIDEPIDLAFAEFLAQKGMA